MDRFAIIEINETETKLLFIEKIDGRTRILKEFKDDFPIGEEIFESQLIKPTTTAGILNVLITYREFIQQFKVDTFTCIAAEVLNNARNQKGFFDEIYNNTGFSFTVLNQDDITKNIFYAVNNFVDISKGNCIYVGDYSTIIIKYNKRTILGSLSLPFGSANFLKSNKTFDEICDIVKNELKNYKNFHIDPIENVVGAGNAFINFGRISKKIERYPLDVDNNYQVSKSKAKKVFDFVKDLDIEKISKIKNMADESSSKLIAGLAVVNAVLDAFSVDDIIVSSLTLQDGLLTALTLNENDDKLLDMIEASFFKIYKYKCDEFSRNMQIAATSALLFKQLKVLHRLSRNYIKPLRVAAYLFDSGKWINEVDFAKYSLHSILNSGINGVSQKDLLIAAFIALCQEPDNFSLAEWMKYKDILDEEDLVAVRKLGILLKLASALSSSYKTQIADLVCEILGDSVIIKIIADDNIAYNVKQGYIVTDNFRKIFKKNLQII